MILATPRSRWIVLAVTVVLFLTALPVLWIYLEGEYPPYGGPADLHRMGNLLAVDFHKIFLILTAPFAWGFICYWLYHYAGRVPLTAWHAARPVCSAVWTLFFGGAAVLLLLGVPWAGRSWHHTSR